jgi:hypothetical protein
MRVIGHSPNTRIHPLFVESFEQVPESDFLRSLKAEACVMDLHVSASRRRGRFPFEMKQPRAELAGPQVALRGLPKALTKRSEYFPFSMCRRGSTI